MSVKTRVTVQQVRTITYDLEGDIPKEAAIQIAKARIEANYELGLKSDITSITSTHIETVKE